MEGGDPGKLRLSGGIKHCPPPHLQSEQELKFT